MSQRAERIGSKVIYSKYRSVRTEYDGVTYDSRAESEWAARLDLLKRAGEVLKWQRQVLVKLGPQITTRVDFKVWTKRGIHFDEIKGVETPAFKQVRRWWRDCGPAPMQICTLKGKRWTIEVLKGARKSVEAEDE